MEALRSVSASEFAMVRAVYEAEPWGREWDHTRELAHVAAVGHGLKVNGRDPRMSDFGPQPRHAAAPMSREMAVAVGRQFVGIAKQFGAKVVSDGD